MSRRDDRERALADLFKAMGHPVRLELLRRIASDEYCVSELHKRIGQSQPSISQHLGVLRERGLVVPIRKGNRTCYRVRDERVCELIEAAEVVVRSR